MKIRGRRAENRRGRGKKKNKKRPREREKTSNISNQRCHEDDQVLYTKYQHITLLVSDVRGIHNGPRKIAMRVTAMLRMNGIYYGRILSSAARSRVNLNQFFSSTSKVPERTDNQTTNKRIVIYSCTTVSFLLSATPCRRGVFWERFAINHWRKPRTTVEETAFFSFAKPREPGREQAKYTYNERKKK